MNRQILDAISPVLQVVLILRFDAQVYAFHDEVMLDACSFIHKLPMLSLCIRCVMVTDRSKTYSLCLSHESLLCGPSASAVKAAGLSFCKPALPVEAALPEHLAGKEARCGLVRAR